MNFISMIPDKLTYVAFGRSSFILQDIDRLKSRIDVISYFFEVQKKISVPFKMLRLFFFLLLKGKSTYLVSFGGYHSFVSVLVARINGSRSYIILNGTDSAAIPEFGYGFLRGGLMKWCCYYSYQRCTRLLPVSSSLVETENTYAFEYPRRIGLGQSFPGNHFSSAIVSNGFDVDFWKQTVPNKESGSFLTVCGSNGYHLKGIDLIFQAAIHFKNCTFNVAGINHLDGAPDNVNFLGFLNKEQLRLAYSQTQFYLQLSIWEGFGCALCEAMLCQCIPIVSNVNILPQLATRDGFILMNRNAEELIDLINEVVKNPPSDVEKFRRHIVENYRIDARIDQLLQVIAS